MWVNKKILTYVLPEFSGKRRKEDRINQVQKNGWKSPKFN